MSSEAVNMDHYGWMVAWGARPYPLDDGMRISSAVMAASSRRSQGLEFYSPYVGGACGRIFLFLLKSSKCEVFFWLSPTRKTNIYVQ